ncbi:MAG TPA: response regulator, partial [bacterium]
MNRETILVVEDEKIVAFEIQETLKKLKYHIPVTVATGEEAIEQARMLSPSLVLMDIKLKGGMDGIECAERLKNELGIPVIFITAHTDKDTFLRSQKAEPFDYIVKPFPVRELGKRIEMALFRADLERKLKDKERLLADTLNGISKGILTVDLAGMVQFANATARNIVGWEETEPIGRALADVLQLSDPGSGETVQLDQILPSDHGTQFPAEWEAQLTTATSEPIPVQCHSVRISNSQGKHAGWLFVFEDLTTQKKLEKYLKWKEASYQELFCHIENGVAILRSVDDGRDFMIVDINPAGEKLCGMKKSDILGIPITQTPSCGRESDLIDLIRDVWTSGKSDKRLLTVHQQDGSIRYIENVLYRLPDGDVVRVFNDV